MKITFLGTGTSQGIPVVACKCAVCLSEDKKDKRLRSSVMIQDSGNNIVIDCGPDFRYQMLRENISNIRAVILTHEHRDHIAGIDDLRSFNWVNKSAVSVYAENRVVSALKSMFSYVFATEKIYPGVPKIDINIIDESPFFIDKTEVIPIRGMHYYIPVLGYRIGDISYITDFNSISESEIQKMKGSKIMVVNALRHEKHISHFTLSEALELIEKINPDRAYITHISHQMEKTSIEEKKLPKGVYFAYDGLTIEI